MRKHDLILNVLCSSVCSQHSTLYDIGTYVYLYLLSFLDYRSSRKVYYFLNYDNEYYLYVPTSCT